MPSALRTWRLMALARGSTLEESRQEGEGINKAAASSHSQGDLGRMAVRRIASGQLMRLDPQSYSQADRKSLAALPLCIAEQMWALELESKLGAWLPAPSTPLWLASIHISHFLKIWVKFLSLGLGFRLKLTQISNPPPPHPHYSACLFGLLPRVLEDCLDLLISHLVLMHQLARIKPADEQHLALRGHGRAWQEDLHSVASQGAFVSCSDDDGRLF